MKKTLIALALLLAACNRQGAMPSTDAVSNVPMAGAAKSAVAPMIVRTADMRILVEDTGKAVDAVTKMIEARGGMVATSNVWRDGDQLRATLTLRVPSNQLTAALASVRGLARRVERETVQSQDVTQEYVDLESQLRNLEATETELRELLKIARVSSKRAADVLEVHAQLTKIRGEIEQAKGRMRYLSQVTAMSTINLEVAADALAPGWHPLRSAREATSALVTLLQKSGTAAIWFVIFVLPVLGTLALFAWLFVRVARRARAA
ncbi:MAG TPA: DUF4349 domain-containing protein [Thermoanaerobaculia bacterium]|nr:DUF4349 domain-containing protein [Thermoanaerobaculia bacterium]